MSADGSVCAVLFYRRRDGSRAWCARCDAYIIDIGAPDGKRAPAPEHGLHPRFSILCINGFVVGWRRWGSRGFEVPGDDVLPALLAAVVQGDPLAYAPAISTDAARVLLAATVNTSRCRLTYYRCNMPDCFHLCEGLGVAVTARAPPRGNDDPLPDDTTAVLARFAGTGVIFGNSVHCGVDNAPVAGVLRRMATAVTEAALYTLLRARAADLRRSIPVPAPTVLKPAPRLADPVPAPVARAPAPVTPLPVERPPACPSVQPEQSGSSGWWPPILVRPEPRTPSPPCGLLCMLAYADVEAGVNVPPDVAALAARYALCNSGEYIH